MISNNLYNKSLKGFARKLRNEPTRAEKKLWYEVLSNKKLNGYKFLRQRPIGNYIVDFFSLELKLVIEVDGISHTFSEVETNDVKREEWLTKNGYTVLRFNDINILGEIEKVRLILENWIYNYHPHSPLEGAN